MPSAFYKQNTLPDLVSGDNQPRFVPKKIGPYKIETLLNKGGMSYLYLGRLGSGSAPIAIKVLSPKFLKNQEMMGRFLKEAQIIGMADHPNIVKLYGQGSWEKGLYIAMEFIRGVSLRQFIQQKSLSHKRALQILLQVSYALCHLHTHGVIHRDLKPENILINENGEVKVIDFGIAQLQGEDDPQSLDTGRIMGTPVYMSPEQKKDPLSVTYASDIYSLGVIAYELILGRLSHGVIHHALLPKPLREIVEKALKTDPGERYPDIVDWITDISHYLKLLKEEEPAVPDQVSDEFLIMLRSAQSILVPKKLHRWAPVDFGLAIQEGVSLSGLYLDAFELPQNRLCIALAEPSDAHSSSLFHCSILRGMLRMAFSHAIHNGKKDLHPITLLNTLNAALHDDPMRGKFSLSLLLLTPEKDRLSFVSCNHGSLWHILEGSGKPRILHTPNPPLGADPNVVLLETADNWHSGDMLILRTKHEELPLTWLAETLHLSPQVQAERILQHLTMMKSPSRHASAVLSIHRLF